MAAFVRRSWTPLAEPGGFVFRAGFASRGMAVGRDPNATRSRPVRDPRCLALLTFVWVEFAELVGADDGAEDALASVVA